MEGDLEGDLPKRPHMTTRKDKKKMSRDMKGALKTKLKLASFIDKAEKLDINETSARKKKGHRKRGQEEEEDTMDVIEIESEDEADRTVASFLEAEDEENEGISTVPYMRKFVDGICYRKLDCNSVLVSIEPPRKLYFVGKALVQVVKGYVDINGFCFGANSKKYTVFSAKGHSSLVFVKAVSRSDAAGSDQADENEGHPSVSQEELLNAQGALIVMEGFENEWCDGFRQIFPDGTNFIGPSITGIGPGKTPQQKMFLEKLGFQFVRSKKMEKYRFLDIPSYWDNVFNDLVRQYDCSNGKVCPFGGKGVGKSTFVRWLTNRYLCSEGKDKVLFLDLDPGQSEFTPPGMISVHICTEPILGPNFTHLKEATRAIYLGGVNVSDFPVSYIKGVAELCEFCAKEDEFKEMPWVINTMGFSQGLGVHLACEVIKIIRPTSVIQLGIDNDRRSFPFFLNKENVSKYRTFLSKEVSQKYQEPLSDYFFLSVKSACNREVSSNISSWGASAKVSREAVLASYFAESIGSAEGFNLRSVVPLRIPLDCVALGTMNSDLTYDGILETLNGNLVALCEMSATLLQSVEGSPKKFVSKAGNYTNNCLGYGIVRAIDKQAETLFVISNLNEIDILLKVNVILAAGAIGLPVYFYVQPSTSTAVEEVPYIMSRNEGTSTLHAAAKKFFVPKRVTHSVLKNCLL